MAANHAIPMPIKNQAYRLTFEAYKVDGTLVTGGTGMDTEISGDGGTAIDCTNESVEIASAWGVYYIDLTVSEMNYDTVAIKCSFTNAGAVPAVIILNPQEAGDIQVNVTYWNGTQVQVDTAGFPKVTHKTGTGLGEIDLTSGIAKVNLAQILGTALTESGAGRLVAGIKKFFDVITPASTMELLTAVTTATNLTNAPSAGDLTATMKTSVTTAASAATPAVTVSDKTGYSLSTAGILAIWHQLVNAIVTAGTIGKLLVDNIDATVSSRTKPADTQAAVTTVTNLTNAPTNGDLTATMKASVTTAATAATPTANALGTQAKTDVQAAMTSQGYTSTRAGYLDTLNGLVAAIWASVTRTLTAGTNIILAKGTGVTGFNDLSAAQVNTEADTALSDVGLNTTITGRIDTTVSSRSSLTAANVWDYVIEGGKSAAWMMRIFKSALAGLSVGAGGANPKFRDMANTKNRIDATVINGDRSIVTLDGD